MTTHLPSFFAFVRYKISATPSRFPRLLFSSRFEDFSRMHSPRGEHVDTKRLFVKTNSAFFRKRNQCCAEGPDARSVANRHGRYVALDRVQPRTLKCRRR